MADGEFDQTIEQLSETAELYEAALRAGKLAAWETDLVRRTRTWTQDAIDMFGLEVQPGVALSMDAPNHLLDAMHPDDRHLLEDFHAQLMQQDEIEVSYRIQRPDSGTRYMFGRGRVLRRNFDGTPSRVVHIITDKTAEYEDAQHRQLLMRELSHRSKNQLTIISVMARQTGRNASSLEDFQHSFSERLSGLSRSIDLLVAGDWHPTPLSGLIRSQLESFAGPELDRITLSCPEVKVAANIAQALGMSLHELATNAVKYGALSNEEGTVDISWQVRRDDDGAAVLSFQWQEKDGPEVVPSDRRGFGSVVLETMVSSATNTTPDYQMHPEGVIWRIDAPIDMADDPSHTT